MKVSFGTALVTVFMTALVALAIFVPVERGGGQSDGLSTELAEFTLPGTNGPYSALEKNDIPNTDREKLSQNQRVRNIIADRRDQLINARGDPSVGDPKATVTIVEFFDYQCPYCRRMAQQLAELNEADPDLRIVYKEFPFLSEASTLAARAGLGAARQGKYEEFHLALMGLRGELSARAIFRVAERIGLDAGRLRADMNSPNAQRMLQRNHRLAQELGIRGTPSFVVGDEVIRGAITIDRLRQLIAQQRKLVRSIPSLVP